MGPAACTRHTYHTMSAKQEGVRRAHAPAPPAGPVRWPLLSAGMVGSRLLSSPDSCRHHAAAVADAQHVPLLHTLLCCSHTHPHKRSRAPASSAALARLPKQLGLNGGELKDSS